MTWIRVRDVALPALVTALLAGLLLGTAAPPAGAASPPATTAVVSPTDVPLPSGAALVGRWEVRTDAWTRAAGPGGTSLVWRSPQRLPLTDARPELRVGSRVVAVPTGTADGNGLVVPLDELGGVDTRRLEVWLGADRLDRAGALAPSLQSVGPGAAAGADAFANPDVLDVDPGVPGPYEVATAFDYTAAPLRWPEFSRSMEVLGHVRMPEGVDVAPLVLLLHGRHAACYRPRNGVAGDTVADARQWGCRGRREPVPSYLGYDYVQRLLASQGYASVSVSANAVNAQDFDSVDGGASARSALVRHHLDLLAQWAADPDRPRWFGRIDVERTVLVGHSRGGEGVARATTDAPTGAPWDVLGDVLVAPTNFARLPMPFTPSVTLLPYCDGDVSDLQGQQFTDLPRDLTNGDTAFRSSVLMRGANHNFFNTEWTPGISVAPSVDDWFDDEHPVCGDDDPTRLSAKQQRDAGQAWIAGAVRLFADDDTDVLAMLDASGAVTVASAAAGAVRTHALGGDRELVRPGADASPTGAGVLCRAIGRPDAFAPPCARGINAQRTVHWSTQPVPVESPSELSLTWFSRGVGAGLALDQPLDLSAAGTTLDLRTVVDPVPDDQRVRIRLTDADGSTWNTDPRRLTGLTGGYIRTYWGQTLRVDPDNAPPRLDVTAVSVVGLVASSPEGRVWVLDAAARRPALLPVPDVRLSTFSLGRPVVVAEGDEAGQASATVRYRLDEPSPRPARVTIAASTYDERVDVRAIELEVPAGVSTGTFEVPYEADDVDDVARRTTYLQAIGQRSVVVGKQYSRVTVRDDDPDARLSVRRETRSVAPGGRMVWRVRLDRPTDYRVLVSVRGIVTTPQARNLVVSDVPVRWADDHLRGDPGPTEAVAKHYQSRVELLPGERSGRVVVPTRANPPRSGSRVLTLQFANPLLPDGPVLLGIRRR